MKDLTCAAARLRLQPYYDRELPVAEEIAVAAHLEWCADCAGTLAEFRTIGIALREVVGGPVLSSDEAAGFHAGVVNRAKAEREVSFFARVCGMFEDLHLVYAGVGATAATAVCVIIMLGMMRFATAERPDSLAAMVAFLATPGSSASAATIDAASHARFSARFSVATEAAEEEAVFALADVVTREGRIAANLRGHHRAAPKGRAHEAQMIEGLLDVVSRARFDDGLPPAANMVWLITQTTVRASQSPNNVDLPLPSVKKRAASIAAARRTTFV